LLELELKLIGDRPGGVTAPDSTLVQLAQAATRAVGYMPRLDCSSTDSNVAISLGVPALTIGAGGSSGCSHTTEEWYDPRNRDHGLKRALLLTLAVVGLVG
jgi:di/tripeptidase